MSDISSRVYKQLYLFLYVVHHVREIRESFFILLIQAASLGIWWHLYTVRMQIYCSFSVYILLATIGKTLQL